MPSGSLLAQSRALSLCEMSSKSCVPSCRAAGLQTGNPAASQRDLASQRRHNIRATGMLVQEVLPCSLQSVSQHGRRCRSLDRFSTKPWTAIQALSSELCFSSSASH